jgi:hypothetical protein
VRCWRSVHLREYLTSYARSPRATQPTAPTALDRCLLADTLGASGRACGAQLYNTGVRFEERIVRTRVAPHSVYLVGSGDAAGPAAIAGAAAAAHLQHAAEAKELEAEERDASLRAQQGATGADAAAAASTASAAASCCSSGPLLVALCLSEDGCVSPAAEAALESARVRLVGARCKLLRAKQTYADPASLPVRMRVSLGSAGREAQKSLLPIRTLVRQVHVAQPESERERATVCVCERESSCELGAC